MQIDVFIPPKTKWFCLSHLRLGVKHSVFELYDCFRPNLTLNLLELHSSGCCLWLSEIFLNNEPFILFFSFFVVL